MHVTAAFDEVVAREAGVEEAGCVSNDVTLAMPEHVLGPELARLLANWS